MTSGVGNPLKCRFICFASWYSRWKFVNVPTAAADF